MQTLILVSAIVWTSVALLVALALCRGAARGDA